MKALILRQLNNDRWQIEVEVNGEHAFASFDTYEEADNFRVILAKWTKWQ